MARSKQAIINELKDQVHDLKTKRFINTYSDFVKSRMNPEAYPVDGILLHMILGVCDEAGELSKVIKDVVGYGKDLDKRALVEELGDLMFFAVGACNVIGIDPEWVMLENMRKLKKRYPDGWTQDAAIERADKKENESSEEKKR